MQIIPLLFPFTVQKYVYPPVNKVHAWSFRVSVNQPKSDMDYRVFNVRTSIILVRVRVHTGGWAHVPTAMSAQHFDSGEKTLTIFVLACAPGSSYGVGTSDDLDLWISNPTLCQLRHPVSHKHVMAFPLQWSACRCSRSSDVSCRPGLQEDLQRGEPLVVWRF